MTSAQLPQFVFYIGYVVQLVGALMLVALFALLRRFVLRRNYFNAWALAWSAIAVALLAVVLRHHLPDTLPFARGSGEPAEAVLPIIYQLGKLLAFALFVEGTLMYVRGRRMHRMASWVWPIAVVYAVATVLLGTPLFGRLQWQALVAVPSLGWCAWALFRLPPSRRTLGNRMAAAGFALTSTLWLGYGVLYTVQRSGIAGAAWDSRLEAFAQLNAYMDLFCSVLLAYAMVVVLMEDAKREVDDAQAELRVVHDQLRRAALYDSLTESLNRRAFQEGVGLDLARGTFGTVVLLDLDNMKAVNDAHGHAAGDLLLRTCAEVVRSGLRASDKLYRWGGDEFLIVLPGAQPPDVQHRLERLLNSALVPIGDDHPQLRLEVSAGVAGYSSAEELESAIAKADTAMYQHKALRKQRRSGTIRAVPMLPVTPIGAPVAIDD